MSDKDSTDADHLRQAKLLAARKKLKKFQSKKLDHPQADTDIYGSKTSHEEPKSGADGVLFSDHGSPLTKRSDSLTIDMDSTKVPSPIAQPFNMTSPPPPPRAKSSVIMSSPPPPPSSAVFENLVSSPQPQSTCSPSSTSPASAHGISALSSPPPHAARAPPPNHWNPSLDKTVPVPQQPFHLLQNKIDALQQEKSALTSQSEQLRQQLTNLHQQFDVMKNQKDESIQQHDALAEKYRLLEQQYGDVKQQLLDANTTLQSQQEKIAELQADLVSTKDEMVSLIKEQQQQQQQHAKHDDDETRRLLEQQQQQDDKSKKWDELLSLVETQKRELDEMTASNEDFHTETTRLIDMVNDLEEELARTQADNYTKDCEIKSLTTQLYDLARGNNHDSLVTDLEQKTQERDTLRQTVKELEADQRRLASLGPELESLKERLTLADQELTSLRDQLDEKHDTIRELQSTLDNKHNDHTTQLFQLQSEHDAIKEAADKWRLQTTDIQRLLDEKTKDHTDLVAKHGTFETVISDLKQQLSHAENSATAKEELMGGMKVSIQQLEHQHDTMKQQLDDTKQLVDGNEQTVNQLRDHIKKLEQIHITLTRDLDAAHEAQATHHQALEVSSVDLDNMQQRYTELKQTLDEKEALYKDLLKIKDDMAHQLDQTHSTNQQHQQVMTERVHRINQKLAHIMAMYEKMEQTATDMEVKVTTAAAEAATTQETNINSNMTTMQGDLETVRQTLAMTESQAKTHLDKIMEMETRSLEQQLYIGKLEADQQSFDEQRRFLEQQLTSLQEELDEKRDLADMFEDARASLVNEQSALLSRLEDQQALVFTLNTQLQDRNNEIDQLQEKIKTLDGHGGGDGGIAKHQDLEQQLKDQTVVQHALISEKEQQESTLNDIRQTMEQLQAHADSLEQQLNSERTASAAANNELKQQLIALSYSNNINSSIDTTTTSPDETNEYLLQQERSQRREQVELLEKQLTSLQEELTELQDKSQEQQQLYDDKHQQWMAEQTKVTSMTEDISRLQEQLQQHLADQQALQGQLDETIKQLDQSAAEDSGHQRHVDQLTNQLKEAQDQVAAKSKEVEELQTQLSSPSPPPVPLDDEEINKPNGSERERALETEVKELRSRLERQFDAFTTIRGELTTVRDRQMDAERESTKERDHLVRERQGLEHTIERLRNEYQEHLERMWEQHEAIREHHEEDLSVGREALDSAQIKLMQNGLSPVSENGFEWVNSDSEQDDEYEQDDQDDDGEGGTTNNNKTPSVGPLPPLRKPDFFEFLETPRCNGCQSEVIDI